MSPMNTYSRSGSKSRKTLSKIALPFRSRKVTNMFGCINIDVRIKTTNAYTASVLYILISLSPNKNGGLTTRTIPKKIKATFTKSTGKMGSLMKILAKKTVNMGDVAIISVASARGSFFEKMAQN